MGRASVSSLDIPEEPSHQERVGETKKVDVRDPSEIPRTSISRTEGPTYASILKNGVSKR